jgi:hypothetical protein
MNTRLQHEPGFLVAPLEYAYPARCVVCVIKFSSKNWRSTLLTVFVWLT